MALVCFNMSILQGSLEDISDEIALVLHWITFAVVCQVISLFGIATNIINIICFIKQGFTDTINICLTGLALADSGSLVTLLWSNVCYTPAFSAHDLPFETTEFQYMTGGIPHTTLTRITACMTATVTLERCLCITMPLKVREIFTKQRVTAIIICMFLVLMAIVSPLYVVNKLGMKYFPLRNKTLIGLIYADNRQQVESVSFTINNVFIPGGAFLVIIVCTLILVVHLERATRWRKKSMFNEQAENLSNRNQKIVKMVLMISILFICSFIPMSVIFLAMSLTPELSIDGKYKNVLTVVGGFCVILESVNSSANIFIYYSMSSKYRVAYRELRIGMC